MAITERTRPYETLVRHNPDGSIGAHHQRISEVVKDGDVIAASLLAPEPLPNAGAADPDLAALIGAAALAAIADADSMRELVAQLQEQVAVLQQQIASQPIPVAS